MGLWIRSQDKYTLVDSKRVTFISVLYGSEERYRIINLNSCMDDETKDCDFLGEYASEERAIEALDEIQKHLVSGSSYDTLCDHRRDIHEKVFNMPQK